MSATGYAFYPTGVYTTDSRGFHFVPSLTLVTNGYVYFSFCDVLKRYGSPDGSDSDYNGGSPLVYQPNTEAGRLAADIYKKQGKLKPKWYYNDWEGKIYSLGTIYRRDVTALSGGAITSTGLNSIEGELWGTKDILFTPTAQSGKRFKSWKYENGNLVINEPGIDASATLYITASYQKDVVIKAYFIDEDATLSIVGDGIGGAISTNIDNVLSANTVSLPTDKNYNVRATATPSSTHYFLGWYSGENGTGDLLSTEPIYDFIFDTADGQNRTVYAYFKAATLISVTTKVLLDGIPEAVNTDGNSFSLVTAEPLKAGVVKFALVYNSSHYWAKPTITISEKLIGGSSDYNVTTLQPSAYAIDLDGNVSLNIAPLQAWVAEQDPINFTISADFAAIPVGATVIQGVNAGTYSWMYSVQFSNWSGRGYTSSEEEPNRPMTPLYGDTGTVTITPFNTSRMKLGRIAVRYGNTTVIDEATTSSTENSYVFTANVTGPMTITVTLKAKIELAYLTTPLPEEITFTVNGTTLTAGQYVYAVVGAPSSVDYSGTPSTTVFEDWYIEEYAPYLVNGAMVAVSSHIAVHPYTFIPNAYMTIYPSFVVADENPYVAIQFYNASSQSVFIPGGSNPTLLQTQDSSNVGGTGQSGSNAGLSPNWSTSTRDAMRVYVRGLSAEDSVFNTAFAEDGSTLFVRLPSLGVLTMEAVGTPSLPFLRFEKASITKGALNPPSDCILGAWSAIDPIVNPASFNVIVACAYRVVFGAYQPQKNIAAFKSSTMRSMGSITVTGYSSSTASDGSVTATTGYGDSVTWVATPFIGYKFTGWYSLSGETYTLVSTDAEYSLEQDSIRRTLYAEFAQDTTKLYLMGGGEQNKTAYWKSKRFELQRPLSFSACRIDAEGYPVQLKTHTFSSPSVSDASDTVVVICEDQDGRRIQTMRKERFCEFSVETLHPVVGMSFSTTMQGLS